ncbi:DUF697 domain-containing protein [Luteimonas sp. MC1750]|uniref:DUF697 domain-containing protein n=1 Tax=Luteimonas sp. MC1750 TaxID=2799326 RepID=UPI0018F0A251|nr:DUF697 domain-containing protein [Luteimonas sp. MC1750]MBJ6984007.1 DUF697 domain-containing protein [Luteimonas sp. MC1750]QQO06819.1 DUF697 domain-containing protein [Luteimonas sp. MC1750]
MDNIAAAVAEATKEMGRVNILIAGRSGVGKSTLINSMFHANLAETGQGRAITMEIKEYTKEGLPVSVIDTRGLEMANYQETVKALEDLVATRAADSDPNKHIHVVWLCVLEDSRRVEEAEIALHQALAKTLPVIGVITKARADNGFKSEVEKLLPLCRNVVRVRAIGEQFDEGHSLPPLGLDTLVELTNGAIPDGHRRAFAAAQKADLNAKRNEARKFVYAAATAAGTAGLSPLPMSDAFLIAPFQIGMIAKITSVFGVPLSNTMMASLVTSAVGVAGASFLGRAVVSNLLKLIPGAGTAAGAAISSTTAAALTTAMGEAYISALMAIFTENPDADPSGQEIGERVKKILREKLEKTEEQPA